MVLSSAEIGRELADLPKDFISLVIVDSKDYATITMRLLNDMIKEMRSYGIYITVNRPYESVVNILKKATIDISKLFFIDCITKTAGGDPEKKKIAYSSLRRRL